MIPGMDMERLYGDFLAVQEGLWKTRNVFCGSYEAVNLFSFTGILNQHLNLSAVD